MNTEIFPQRREWIGLKILGKITRKLDQDAGNFNSHHADVCAAGKDNAVEHFIYKWAMRRYLKRI